MGPNTVLDVSAPVGCSPQGLKLAGSSFCIFPAQIYVCPSPLLTAFMVTKVSPESQVLAQQGSGPSLSCAFMKEFSHDPQVANSCAGKI